MRYLSIKKYWQRLQSDGHGAILARGAIGAFIVKIVGAGLLFGLHVMLARLLGVEQYGIYVYAVTWINILAILCLLGFQTSLVRFIAEYNIKQQWGLLRGILRRSEQFVLGFSVLVSLAGLIFIWIMDDRISAEIAVTFYIAFALLPVFALCWLREASLRALKLVIQSQLLLRVIRPLVLGGLVAILFFLFGGTVKAVHVMASNLVAVITVFLLGTTFLYRGLPAEVFANKREYTGKKWIKVSLPLLLITGMHILLKRTDIVMVGFFLGTEDAGMYAAASKISDLVGFALVAINTILAPMISELYHTDRQDGLQRIITLAARAIFVFTLLASIFLGVFGKSVLGLFGSEFAIAYFPLLVLLAGQIVNALAGSVAMIMMMTEHQKQAGVIITLGTILNIMLNIFFIQLFGMIGAAISTALCMAFWNIAMLLYVRLLLKINPTILAKLK